VKSFVESEITITAKQLASAKAHVRKQVHAAALRVWAEDSDGLDFTFGEEFYRALEAMDIELHFDAMPPEFSRGRLITATEAEGVELEQLQEAVWRKRIGEGGTLPAAVEDLFDASFGFLGIKVKAAQRIARERPRLRRAA